MDENHFTETPTEIKINKNLHKLHTWKDYLFQFLMLFLAVLCGFYVENQRELLGERELEHQYMQSMVEDINNDVTQSNLFIHRIEETIKGLDSLLETLSSLETAKDSRRAYRLWTANFGFKDFIYNDRTIQQLKNSGGLRLIQKHAVSDSIMQYDQSVRNFNGQQELMNRVIGDQRVFNQFFDFIRLERNKNSLPVPLSEHARNYISEAYADRMMWKSGLSSLLRDIKEVNEKGKRTMKFIEKEYHIK
jgi:hypothetical protein